MASKVRQMVPKIEYELACRLADSMERVFGKLIPLRQARNASELSVTPLEGRAMLWIARHNECLMSEFSRGVDVPLSTATRLVDRLAGKGLLIRKRSEEDRRVVRVALSELGRQIERQTREHTVNAIGEMLRRLTPQEQKQLIHLLQAMTGS